MEDALLRLGVRRPDRPNPGPDLYGPMLRIMGGPQQPGPWDFGRESIQKDLMELAPQFVRHSGSFRANREVPIFKRIVGGWLDHLQVLRARVDVASIVAPWIAS